MTNGKCCPCKAPLLRFPDGICRPIDDCVPRNPPTSNCTGSEFHCKAGWKSCIPASWRCDRERDCADGSDEVPAMCCPDLNCGPNKIPNANTCKCSGCTNSCPPEKRLNAGSCVCECSSFCGPHRNQDPTTCACSACTNKCGENQSLNPNTCECQCKKPCVQFKTQDPESCSCSACTNSCEANEFLNTDTCVCGSCPMNEKLTTQYTRVDPDCRPEGFTDCRKVSSSVFCKCVKGFVRHKKNCVLPASTCPKVISMA